MKKYIFIIFTISPLVLRAQSASEAIHIVENEVGYGARSLAMGGAFTPLGDGPAGMYWNPAGLADIKNGSLYFESYFLRYRNNTSYLEKLHVNPFNLSRFNGIGAIYPIATVRGSFVIGLGFNRIHHYDDLMSFSGYSNVNNGLEFPINVDGQLLNYRFDQGVQRYEKIMSNGARDQITFSFGVALSPDLAAGLSISRMSGDESYDFEFLQQDVADNFQEFPSDFMNYELFQSLSTKTKSMNIRAGLKYNFSPFRFGFSVALPYNISVEENHGTQERLIFDNSDYSDAIQLGYYDYRILMPATIDFGAALVTESNLTLSMAFRIQDWSKMQFNLKDFASDSDEYIILKNENESIVEDYKNVSQLRFGGEYLFPITSTFGCVVRFGLAYIPSPKTSGSEEKAVTSVGLGVPIYNKFIFDMAYLYSYQKKESSDAYVPSYVDEEINKNQFLFNLSYLF